MPRSLPLAQNPERALGVVFDSDASVGQDDIPGTKLTVMLGGHWWQGWTELPHEEEGAAMAQAVIRRHLGVAEEPVASRVSVQKDCIPQYTVGHSHRMVQAHKNIRSEFASKLTVAGSSYTGVGVNDCIRSAWDAAECIIDGIGGTGLEQFASTKSWALMPKGKTLEL